LTWIVEPLLTTEEFVPEIRTPERSLPVTPPKVGAAFAPAEGPRRNVPQACGVRVKDIAGVEEAFATVVENSGEREVQETEATVPEEEEVAVEETRMAEPWLTRVIPDPAIKAFTISFPTIPLNVGPAEEPEAGPTKNRFAFSFARVTLKLPEPVIGFVPPTVKIEGIESPTENTVPELTVAINSAEPLEVRVILFPASRADVRSGPKRALKEGLPAPPEGEAYIRFPFWDI
jgi:hypothetical protein